MIEITHASLFSGIGGFDLAAEIVRFKNLFTCEKDEFCNKILKYYWPNIEHYGDIKTTDFRIWRGKIDILTGGFPCQPFSLAGKRKGTEDDRHLWPEMLRAISEIQPGFIIGENVYGIVNWDGGLVFDQVQSDLEAQGYEIIPIILPACAVGAPHRRERVWFVAYANKRAAGPSRTSERTFGSRGNNNDEPQEWREQTEQRFRYGNVFGNDTNTNNTGLQRSEKPGSIKESGKERDEQPTRFFQPTWDEFPTQSPICSGDDGLSGRLDSITFPKWRNESIKAMGNAIVPEVAVVYFKIIEQIIKDKLLC